jgi:hypothetical protein
MLGSRCGQREIFPKTVPFHGFFIAAGSGKARAPRPVVLRCHSPLWIRKPDELAS